jgi:hypothetical protein
MNKKILITSLALLGTVAITQAQISSYVILNNPLATSGSYPQAVSGNYIAGFYYSSGSYFAHGFLYDGSAYTTLDAPAAAYGTSARGVSGNSVVGYYLNSSGQQNGFIYNGGNYTTLNHPLGVNGTDARGISGNTIVGSYLDSGYATHGFIYDGSTFTTMDSPLGTYGSALIGISGNNILGFYMAGADPSYFLFNGSVSIDLNDPLASVMHGGTTACGVDGNNVVGYYFDANSTVHGFLYDGNTYTTLDIDGATGTQITGIDGDHIVGTFSDAGGGHSFEAQITPIPEPSTVALAALGGASLLLYRRRR